MTFGIQQIASYIPKERDNNFNLTDKFDIDADFITNKIGVESRSNCNQASNVDLALEAIDQLNFQADQLDLIVVVSQNSDYKIPHTSAILHNKIGAAVTCMTFDISQGCSGYVHGLNIINSIMASNQLNQSLLITVDPYSKIIDPDDKNTALLFGDAATATLITAADYLYSLENFTFGTVPDSWQHLTCPQGGHLYMNGREIYNFVLRHVVPDINHCLEKNNVTLDDIDSFIFHQGSKYVVDTLKKRLKIDANKVPYVINHFGNTVSSSIPIILKDCLDGSNKKKLLLSGFGVGLTYSSSVLTCTQ